MNVCIVGFDHAYASPMVCLTDIFKQAERMLPDSHGGCDSSKMSVRLVSVDGRPIRCKNDFQLKVHGAVGDIQKADILIVTSISDIAGNLSKYGFLVDWLINLYNQGTVLASVCTGAFLLAETGLLDGKEATTHWTTSDLFKERYPGIRLSKDRLITNNGDLYCADSKDSGVDLAYYLVDKYLGHMPAAGIAGFFAHDLKGIGWPASAIGSTKAAHNDLEILKIQRWIEDHLAEPVNINDLSEIACMSLRTFERRFKKATGDTPLAYLQRMRVGAARQLLETTNHTFDEISYLMGYKNSGSFRKIFVKWANLLPSEYRKES